MKELELLSVRPDAHSGGIGYAAWCAIEEMYLDVWVWGLMTPYFETRNIHFYVNRCGFHIVEFVNPHHPGSNLSQVEQHTGEIGSDRRKEMDFRFEKMIPRELGRVPPD